MLKVVSIIRELHPDVVLIIDDYQNYYIYDRDVYIVFYLLNLTIKKYNGNVFIRNNINYLSYLVFKLNEFKISYMVLTKRFGYDVSQGKIYLNNHYQNFYVKGKLVYERTKEINKIYFKLKLNILENKNKISVIKELISGGI